MRVMTLIIALFMNIQACPPPLVRHRGRCCVDKNCPPGFQPARCRSDRPWSSSCQLCPPGKFSNVTTTLSTGGRCWYMRVCDFPGTNMRYKLEGNHTHDAVCECVEGYYKPPKSDMCITKPQNLTTYRSVITPVTTPTTRATSTWEQSPEKPSRGESTTTQATSPEKPSRGETTLLEVTTLTSTVKKKKDTRNRSPSADAITQIGLALIVTILVSILLAGCGMYYWPCLCGLCSNYHNLSYRDVCTCEEEGRRGAGEGCLDKETVEGELRWNGVAEPTSNCLLVGEGTKEKTSPPRTI